MNSDIIAVKAQISLIQDMIEAGPTQYPVIYEDNTLKEMLNRVYNDLEKVIEILNET